MGTGKGGASFFGRAATGLALRAMDASGSIERESRREGWLERAAKDYAFRQQRALLRRRRKAGHLRVIGEPPL